METPAEKLLNSRFSQCGLNADWSVTTWRVRDGLFITDDEDGNYSLVTRDLEHDANCDEPSTEVIATVTDNEISSLIARALSLASEGIAP